MIEDENEVVPFVSEEDVVPEVNTQLIEGQCGTMKVAEFKNALGLHNLSNNGGKQELLDCLLVAVCSNAPIIANKTRHIWQDQH